MAARIPRPTPGQVVDIVSSHPRILVVRKRIKGPLVTFCLVIALLALAMGCSTPSLQGPKPPQPTRTPRSDMASATSIGSLTPSVPRVMTTPTLFHPTLQSGPTEVITTEPLRTRVDSLLARMTIEEKVGQLLMVYFTDPFFSPALERMITQYHVGGILIFNRNVRSMIELAQLIKRAQAAAISDGAGIPLFVAVDQEGGPIVRLTEGATVFPSNMAVGATGSAADARLMAQVMAAEMKAMGINMNLAPVLDVNNNPDNPVIGIRSFSSSPELVAKMGVAMIQAYQDSGVIATAKHFPGHGDTNLDSHTVLPRVDRDLAHLEGMELVPFRAAIGAGVDAIMTAHVVFPALDPTPDRPATLSPAVLQGLLRDRMGFEGLIATDSLGMGAIDERYGVTNAAALSFQAGADLLLFGNDPGHSPAEQPPAYERILSLVKGGTIPMHRLDDCVRRILVIKAKYGLLDRPPVSVKDIPHVVGTTEHQAFAQQVAQDSITLVKDDQRLLPLDPEASIVAIYPRSIVALGPALGQFSPDLRTMGIGIDPTAADIDKAQRLVAGVDVVILGTLDARWHPAQVQLLKALSRYPLIVVDLGAPYDLLALPELGTYLVTYGDVPVSLRAVARVIFGLEKPKGHLPVELPGLYPLGHGLTGFPRLEE